MSHPFLSPINDFLGSLFQSTTMGNRRVYDAAQYSLLLPGKRLRPLITLSILEAFGLEAISFIKPACAVELVHTYSLIHDDLPCMDDDDIRRGKPSLHIAFDEATALLAGDLLLTHSFHLIAQSEILSERQRVQLITHLSHAAGGEGMIGGQMLDLLGERREVSHECIEQLHTGKTGALLGYAFAAGGIIADSNEVDTLDQIGRRLGLAFQIIDDVLDATQTSEQLGKPAGSDSKNNKLTILSTHSIEDAYAYAEKLLILAQESMYSIFPNNRSLEQIIDSMVHRIK